MIDVEDAISLLPEETDQVVRRALAQVLADRGEPAAIRQVLLRGRSAEGRVQGLVRLRPPDLTNDDVLPLLADSSVLVRLWARKRWHELGGDPVQGCRHLIESAATPSQRAHAYIGLSEAGAKIDRSEILGLVREPEPALQKAGLRLLRPVAAREDIPETLHLVRSTSSRVARLAIDVLAANLGLWSLADAAGLKEDPEPEIRRRAWLLHRSRGGWDRLIGELEILGDSDEKLARLDSPPKAPMYVAPTEEQRARIGQLLSTVPLKRDLKMEIAFAAGLTDLTAELRSQPRWTRSPPETQTPRQEPDSWWRKLFRRRPAPGRKR